MEIKKINAILFTINKFHDNCVFCKSLGSKNNMKTYTTGEREFCFVLKQGLAFHSTIV